MPRRLPTACVLSALLLLPALLRADDATQGDKDLDGMWEATATTHDAQDRNAPMVGKGVWTIAGDTLTTKAGDMDARKATIKVDASKTPKTLDLTPQDGPDKGKTYLCVYTLKGDDLRICFADAGKDRPTEIAAKFGSGWTIVALKRASK